MNIVPLCLFMLLIFFSNSANTARILALSPLVYFSHQNFYRPLWKELARRGHEVVLYTNLPVYHGDIPNLIQHDLSSVTNSLPMQQVNYTPTTDITIKNHLKLVIPIHEAQLASEPFQKLINNRSEHFDVVMVEIYAPEMFSFKKRFNAPLIIQSPMHLPNEWVQSTGSPVHPLLYSYFQIIPTNPGYFERICTVFSSYRVWWNLEWQFTKVDDISKKYFGADALTVDEVKKEVDLFFVNINHILYETQPLVPAIVPLSGGMFLSDDQPEISQELKDFLDESIEGVIYFSLGTVITIHSLSRRSQEAIIDTFPLLPYKILWKTDALPTDILQTANRSGNVFTSTWLPQIQVLKHKNVKIFVTHGGMQSLEEAIIFNKPTIVIPFFADQHANAHRMEILNLGANLDINTLTSPLFQETIQNVVTNKDMHDSLVRHSRLLLDQPMKPLEKAVWWVEYVIRNKGARHLHGKYLPWWQAIYFDIIVLLLSVISCFVYIIAKVFCILKPKVLKLKQN